MDYHVTLKKASSLERAAKEASDAIVLADKITFSIFTNQTVDDLAIAAQEKFSAQLDEARNLIQAHFRIRALIKVENAKNGADDLMNTLKGMEMLAKRYSGLLERTKVEYGDQIESDPVIVKTQIAARLKQYANASVRHVETTVTMKIVTEAQTKWMQDGLAGIKRQRAELHDTLAALNLNTKIKLPPDVVQTLTAAGIIG